MTLSKVEALESHAHSRLTRRQQMVLDFIKASIEERGYPPTLREIGRHMGIRSTNGVNDHLRALERKGFLAREDMKSRALRPMDNGVVGRDAVDVPILGRVAAGVPLLAEEHLEDTVKVDRFFVGDGSETFMLRVRGDSMIEAAIHDGDYIFVRKQMVAERGQIVVVMLGDEATVKQYYPEKDYVRFQPANAALAPIIVRREDLSPTQILGVVVGVYRRI